MHNEEIVRLTEKYTTGNCSKEEIVLLENWYLQWVPDMLTVDIQELVQAKADVMSRLPVDFQHKSVVKKIWPRFAVAAAAVAAIVFGVWFFSAQYMNGRHPDLVSGTPNYANDVVPGKNTATLTLANGKTIQLSEAKTGVVVSDEKLTYNDGSMLGSLGASSSVPTGVYPRGGERGGAQQLTAATPRGGTYQVILPDGTHVWLNADSKISFPSQFPTGIRKILLSGEAYFEVSKDKAHPFVVQTDKQKVTVLGTHFNINSYTDEGSTKTTLLEGSVRVNPLSQKGSLSEGKRGVTLKPNQQSVLTMANEIKVKTTNTEDMVAWKDGFFVFNRERLENIMLQIGRWYNVEVEYSDKKIANETFSGTVTRFANISIVLKRLEVTGNVKFKINGRRIVVSR